MRIIFIIFAVALVGSGTSGLFAWSEGPADEGAINRARADRVMCETYGNDWCRFLSASVTNRAQVKAMVETYEQAIGYHRAK